MKCKNCGNELILPSIVYYNLEFYNVGGANLIASSCCNTGYLVKMNISYKVTEYTGIRNEDDWGTKLNKKH